jgi:ABC-type multidrug transport system ATPase subunit
MNSQVTGSWKDERQTEFLQYPGLIMENPIVLQINKGLEIGYKRRCIAKLNDDLRFRRGEISLLLGSNGQGKTTLMKTLSGLLPAVAGHVKKVRTMFVSDEVEFPACLTPLEIVSCFDPAGDYCDLARELIDSLELQNKCYGVLSKGNRQKARIVFAEVLARVREVELLALDEPFAGLDFQARDCLVKRWIDAKNPKLHLVVSMHPSEIASLPSQIILVGQGQIDPAAPETPWRELRPRLQKTELCAA